MLRANIEATIYQRCLDEPPKATNTEFQGFSDCGSWQLYGLENIIDILLFIDRIIIIDKI